MLRRIKNCGENKILQINHLKVPLEMILDAINNVCGRKMINVPFCSRLNETIFPFLFSAWITLAIMKDYIDNILIDLGYKIPNN